MINGGADERRCTSVAPAFLKSLTILAQVVPLTIESSTNTILLPFTVAATGLSLILTLSSLTS